MGWDQGQDAALQAIRGAFSRGFREFSYTEQFATPLTIILHNVVGDKVVVPIRQHDLDMFIAAKLLYSTSPRGSSYRTGKVLDTIYQFEHHLPDQGLPAVHVSGNSGVVSVGHGNNITLAVGQITELNGLREQLIHALAKEIIDDDRRAEISTLVDSAIEERTKPNWNSAKVRAFLKGAYATSLDLVKAAPGVLAIAKALGIEIEPHK